MSTHRHADPGPLERPRVRRPDRAPAQPAGPENLASRLTDAGDLILAGDSHRSQRRNREDVTQRLAALVREALIPPKPRKKTRPTRASKEKRLDEKKRKSRTKKDRGKKYDGIPISRSGLPRSFPPGRGCAASRPTMKAAAAAVAPTQSPRRMVTNSTARMPTTSRADAQVTGPVLRRATSSERWKRQQTTEQGHESQDADRGAGEVGQFGCQTANGAQPEVEQGCQADQAPARPPRPHPGSWRSAHRWRLSQLRPSMVMAAS